MISTVSFDQQGIIQDIITLYCPNGLDADVTYSFGKFYNERTLPRFGFDVMPQVEGVIAADVRQLPIRSASLLTIAFDPPFLEGGSRESGLMKRRFTTFRSQHEVRAFYLASLVELYRVLKPSGILVFKCQDTIESSTQILNHCLVWEMATRLGFIVLDLFIIIAKGRMSSPSQAIQQHARKFHSYFWVFQKGKRG